MKVEVEQASRAELIELVKHLLVRVQTLEDRIQELAAENERLRSDGGPKQPPPWVKANGALGSDKRSAKSVREAMGATDKHRPPPLSMRSSSARSVMCRLRVGVRLGGAR